MVFYNVVKRRVQQHPFEFFGLILGIIAFVVSIYEVNEVRTILHKSESIDAQITTKPLLDFPENLSVIIKKIEEAKDSVIIVVDQPAYGSLSNPEKFAEYWFTLKLFLAKKNTHFKLVCPCKFYRRHMRRKQFLKAGIDSSSTLEMVFAEKSGAIKENIRTLYKFTTEQLIASPETLAAFRPDSIVQFYQLENFLDSVSSLFITKIKDVGTSERTEIYQTHAEITLNCWKIDNAEMVFTIITYGRETKEYSFTTRDNAFMEVSESSFRNLTSTAGFGCFSNNCPTSTSLKGGAPPVLPDNR